MSCKPSGTDNGSAGREHVSPTESGALTEFNSGSADGESEIDLESGENLSDGGFRVDENGNVTAVNSQSASSRPGSTKAPTIKPNTVFSPLITPGGGAYTFPQKVTVTTATAGATIRYTTDGSEPSSKAGTVYSAPFSVTKSTTVKVIAYKSGMVSSSVISATYVAKTQDGNTSEPITFPFIYPLAMATNGSFLSNSAYPPAMLDTGARMYRFDVPFSAVRQSLGSDPAKWDWSRLDKMRALNSQFPGLEILPIMGYKPSWLTNYDSAAFMPAPDPKNFFGHFAYESVNRYKDIITYWESWNEPDLPGHVFFDGNGADFFKLQKAFYLGAKAADPNCQVLFAGLSYASVEGYLYAHNYKVPSLDPPKTSFFEEYLLECANDPDAADNNYYFDIMNQHSYTRASDLYDYTMINQKMMLDYIGVVKPTWITEMGTTDTGPGMFSGNADEYCDYLLQSFAWGSMAGVQRFFHFQLDNSNGHGLYSGMLGSPKPALTTYRDVLAKEFSDVQFYAQLHGTKGVGFLQGNSAWKPAWKAGYNAFEFRNAIGTKRVIVAFADKAEGVDGVKIPATAGKSAVLIDRHNQRQPIAQSGGFYTVSLPGATNLGGWPLSNPSAGTPEHLVGGATYVIVEQ
ncbi:MAG: chitobiase/beta-hexosaminidase C-terminal domain-containing protein [Oscillospiraceae bacterium]|nr:chitobiase/beta-hexosaminidase C-terminal domain-containing protein [Oscillospiraceae bacterium]